MVFSTKWQRRQKSLGKNSVCCVTHSWKVFFYFCSNSSVFFDFFKNLLSHVFKSLMKSYFIYARRHQAMLSGRKEKNPTDKASKMKAWKTNKTNIYDLFNFRVYFYQRRKTIFPLSILFQTRFIVLVCWRKYFLLLAIKWHVFVLTRKSIRKKIFVIDDEDNDID